MPTPVPSSSRNPSLGWLAKSLALLGVSGGGGGGPIYPKLIQRKNQTMNLTTVGQRLPLLTANVDAGVISPYDIIEYAWAAIGGDASNPGTMDLEFAVNVGSGPEVVYTWTGLNAALADGYNRLRVFFTTSALIPLVPDNASVAWPGTSDITITVTGILRTAGDVGGFYFQQQSLQLVQL